MISVIFAPACRPISFNQCAVCASAVVAGISERKTAGNSQGDLCERSGKRRQSHSHSWQSLASRWPRNISTHRPHQKSRRLLPITQRQKSQHPRGRHLRGRHRQGLRHNGRRGLRRSLARGPHRPRAPRLHRNLDPRQPRSAQPVRHRLASRGPRPGSSSSSRGHRRSSSNSSRRPRPNRRLHRPNSSSNSRKPWLNSSNSNRRHRPNSRNSRRSRGTRPLPQRILQPRPLQPLPNRTPRLTTCLGTRPSHPADPQL
jgi:hypothetical protein